MVYDQWVAGISFPCGSMAWSLQSFTSGNPIALWAGSLNPFIEPGMPKDTEALFYCCSSPTAIRRDPEGPAIHSRSLGNVRSRAYDSKAHGKGFVWKIASQMSRGYWPMIKHITFGFKYTSGTKVQMFLMGGSKNRRARISVCHFSNGPDNHLTDQVMTYRYDAWQLGNVIESKDVVHDDLLRKSRQMTCSGMGWIIWNL